MKIDYTICVLFCNAEYHEKLEVHTVVLEVIFVQYYFLMTLVLSIIKQRNYYSIANSLQLFLFCSPSSWVKKTFLKRQFYEKSFQTETVGV